MPNRIKRYISIILALVMCVGLMQNGALAFFYDLGSYPPFPDDDKGAPGYAAYDASYTISEYKYFLFAEYPEIFPLSHGTLGQGTSGEELYPMIPGWSEGFIFEFVVEQSQDIRLELWSATPGANAGDPAQANEYLGLIASGFCEGQWGDLADRETGEKPGEKWYGAPEGGPAWGDEKPVANRLYWDGTYWDNADEAYVMPGIGKSDWDGVQKEFEFIVRFQPTDEDTKIWQTDLPIKIDYSDEAIAKNAGFRSFLLSLIEEGIIPCYGGDPVYMPTGNFTWDYTDFAVYGAIPPATTAQGSS